jgi:S-adenosylmethionine-dependent carboxyl methyltransferase
VTPLEAGSTAGMKGGGYYDVHSEYQRRVLEGGDALIERAVAGTPAGEATFAIADYGAGTGATSVHAMTTAIEAVRARDPGRPVLAIHNDQITSDFTQLFRNVAGGYASRDRVYPAAVAGSFFGRVLPDGTVHLGMCSNAAHWLSEQPEVASPSGMFFTDAPELRELAARDWHAFASARAAELAPGGRLLVQGIATDGDRVSAQRLLEIMWRVATEMARDGLLDRGLLDRYVFPVYCRGRDEIEPPPGLELEHAAIDDVPNPYWEMLERDGDRAAYADAYTAFVRAFSESTLTEHLFGGDPKLCDDFFDRFRLATEADPEAGRYEAFVLRAVFARV